MYGSVQSPVFPPENPQAFFLLSLLHNRQASVLPVLLAWNSEPKDNVQDSLLLEDIPVHPSVLPPCEVHRLQTVSDYKILFSVPVSPLHCRLHCPAHDP